MDSSFIVCNCHLLKWGRLRFFKFSVIFAFKLWIVVAWHTDSSHLTQFVSDHGSHFLLTKNCVLWNIGLSFFVYLIGLRLVGRCAIDVHFMDLPSRVLWPSNFFMLIARLWLFHKASSLHRSLCNGAIFSRNHFLRNDLIWFNIFIVLLMRDVFTSVFNTSTCFWAHFMALIGCFCL